MKLQHALSDTHNTRVGCFISHNQDAAYNFLQNAFTWFVVQSVSIYICLFSNNCKFFLRCVNNYKLATRVRRSCLPFNWLEALKRNCQGHCDIRNSDSPAVSQSCTATFFSSTQRVLTWKSTPARKLKLVKEGTGLTDISGRMLRHRDMP